jgi:hypothetical protein
MNRTLLILVVLSYQRGHTAPTGYLFKIEPTWMTP